jgi:hypothetical protein
MAIKDIDFSKGIRAEEIQENFVDLEAQLNRERLSVSGSGISSGLDFAIKDFNVEVSSGMLVDVNGEEISIAGKTIAIQLPRLVASKTTLFTVQADGVITLPEKPYSITRKCAAQYDISDNYGISIIDYENASKKIPVINISGNNLIVDASWTGKLVYVTYQHTNKRYDVLYIDTNNSIKVSEGLTSNAPTPLYPSKSLYKYILGIVEVDPFFTDMNGSVVAALSIEKDLKSLRNVYTDKNNVLYIRGIAFDKLQIIHVIEPLDPEINTLWYDFDFNKLRVWRNVDGIEQWVNVNDISVIPVKEVKIWAPENNPADRQFFIFDYNKDLNMRFIPNRQELEIVIDNGAVHTDQFEEITIESAKNDVTLKQRLIASYGYTEEMFNSFNANYENAGIGFKLAQPLDKKCYVEVRATHRVNENPLATRFQRSATFTYNNSFVADSNIKTYTTDIPYRVKEGQLEVYLAGKRLSINRDFVESYDTSDEQGALTSSFFISVDIPTNAVIEYKITTNIYSYDHVEKAMGSLGDRINQAEATAKAADKKVTDFVQQTNSTLSDFNTRLGTVEQGEQEHSQFVKHTDVLAESNMPTSYQAWIPKALINTSVAKSSDVVPITGVSPEDFIVMFDMQGTTGNSILRRGTDYNIVKDAQSGAVYINFTAGVVANGHTIYVTGIKFKN